MFRPASRKQILLRAVVYGPDTSTVAATCLRLAVGLAGEGRPAVIDTVDGVTEHFATSFAFDINVLPDSLKGCEGVANAIVDAAEHGAKVLVINDGSVPWQDLRASVDAKKVRGVANAWAEANPIHDKMMEAIRDFPGHLLFALRAEPVWVVDRDGDRSFSRRIGGKPEATNGIDNEFHLVLAVDGDGEVTVEKDTALIVESGDRFGSVTLGVELAKRLAIGLPVPTQAQRDEIRNLCIANRLNTVPFLQLVGGIPDTREAADAAIEKLRGRLEAKLRSDAPPTSPPAAPAAAPAPPKTEATPTTTTATPTTSAPAKEPTKDPKPTATQTLLAFKKALAAVNDEPSVAGLVADWQDRIATLPKRQQASAQRVASARLAGIHGTPLDADDKGTVEALDLLAAQAEQTGASS